MDGKATGANPEMLRGKSLDGVEPVLATVSEVARYLRLSRATVYKLMTVGQLPHLKLGKSRRVPWEAVERLVRESME